MIQSALVVKVSDRRFVIAGEGLEWLARHLGYASPQAMVDDPASRKKATLEQLIFAEDKSRNRATRRQT